MRLDDLFDQRQTQSHAAVAPSGAAINLIEPLKDPIQFIGRNADAGIRHFKHGLAKLADPDRLIRPGDSGGGAFFDNQLVGNTWSIDMDPAGNSLGAFNVALVPFQVIN